MDVDKFGKKFADKSADKIVKIVRKFGLIPDNYKKENTLKNTISDGIMSFFSDYELESISFGDSVGIAGHLVHEVLVDYFFNEKKVKINDDDLTEEDIAFGEKLGEKLEDAINDVLSNEISKCK